MSGGVDSSVAAALLVDQGYEVVGLMARLWTEPSSLQPGDSTNRCCAPEAVDDARRVAAALGIPFFLLSLGAEFKSRIVDPFVCEYTHGRTPNPCVACNKIIRFGRLMQHAKALGASHLATGHYAQVSQVEGRFHVCKGRDPGKDQSYVLYTLGQEELARVLFPLGHLTKSDVREIARQRRLPVAERAESMDLCFARDGDYRRFLAGQAPESVRPGPILDTTGREIGRHQGMAFFTVGQRRGIGVAAAVPLYVIRLDPTRNAIIVGPADALGRESLEVRDAHYPQGQVPEEPIRVMAKIRYRAAPAPATWTATGDCTAQVRFDGPARGVSPGQSAVAYRGDSVFGGGVICE